MVGMETGGSGFEVDTGPFMVATVFIGAGVLLGFIGFIIAALHALSQSSQVINQMETPPNELARVRMNQMKAAARAGANGWKEFVQADGGSPPA